VKRYVLGFALTPEMDRVALIQKNRPDWQAGKWNGIGGHIEDGESPLEAMHREFQEETGVYIAKERWISMGEMGSDDWNCRLFYFLGYESVVVNTMTDEKVMVHNIQDLRKGSVQFADPNVGLFLSLAMMQGPVIKEIYLAY